MFIIFLLGLADATTSIHKEGKKKKLLSFGDVPARGRHINRSILIYIYIRV